MILYDYNIDRRQLSLEEPHTASLIKGVLTRWGRPITEFTVELEGETVEVLACTPTKLSLDEQDILEELIKEYYWQLKLGEEIVWQ
jgi:hypothetical protein